MNRFDFAIIGAGIIGLTLAYKLKKKIPNVSILIIDKENEVGTHASGRNSGVLHAGFYYTADSLKAKFCVDGHNEMKVFCEEHKIQINNCGKLVVAQNEDERVMLHELKNRGDNNGSEVYIISEEKAMEIEPNVKTFEEALWSPNTSSVNPRDVCNALKNELENFGITFRFNEEFKSFSNKVLTTSKQSYQVNHLINVAGAYSEKIAKQFGLAKNYTMIPFKGVYLKCNSPLVKRHIYPVPNLNNPFLGVHYTVTSDQVVKIGPTAIPVFWRENYSGFSRFKLNECIQILFYQSKLWLKNSFNFRALAREEMKKFKKSYLIALAKNLIQVSEKKDFGNYLNPGIRAQLLNTKTNELVQDFLIEKGEYSTHVLNIISPGFTCSFAFSEYIVENYILNR